MPEIESPKPETKFNICSMTLTLLGCEPISSFDDATTEAKLCKQNYDLFKRSLLAAYPWKFATRQEILGRLAEKPLFGFKYIYQLPNDWCRILSMNSESSSRSVEYKIMRGKIYSDAESLIAKFVYVVDEQDLPAYFVEVLVAKMASEFCIALTESASKAELFEKRFQLKFAQARNLDAQQDTCNAFADESLAEVR